MEKKQQYFDLANKVVESSLLGWGFPIDIETGRYTQQSIELIELLVQKQLEEAIPVADFEVTAESNEKRAVNLYVKIHIGNESSQLVFVEI